MKLNLLIETIGINDRMIVNDQTTFGDLFIDNKFDSSNDKMPDDSKVYINDLIKKTNEDKK